MANDYNRISDAQYEATMRREGTAEWTIEDARIKREYLMQESPSDKQYTAAMERHGSGDFSDEDARVVRGYLKARGADDAQVANVLGESKVDDAEDTDKNEEVVPSPGNSSSTSDSKPGTSNESSLDSGLSPALTTESPSVKGQTDTSSASRTAGTKSNTEGKAHK